MSDFAELVARSCFSFLEGASHPEELVARAKEQGLFALGLCDRDGLYGSVRAHAEAKKLGQRLLVGADLTLELEPISERSARGKVPLGAPRLALLVEDHAGYEALCHHLTVSHADHEKGEAALSPEELATRPEGLFALLPIHTREDAEAPWVSPLREAFGERFAFVTYRAFDGRDGERTRAVLDAAARFGAPIVASARPLYHRPEQKAPRRHPALHPHKTTLDQRRQEPLPNAEARLRSGDTMLELFRDRPDWVERTVADRRSLRLHARRARLPLPQRDALLRPGERADRGPPSASSTKAAGAATRGHAARGGHAQIDKELALIARSASRLLPQRLPDRGDGPAPRILCQGRGSAANSAVCFVLGVTAVDPARSNLLFERFLSVERPSRRTSTSTSSTSAARRSSRRSTRPTGGTAPPWSRRSSATAGKSAMREVGKVLRPLARGRSASSPPGHPLRPRGLSSERGSPSSASTRRRAPADDPRAREEARGLPATPLDPRRAAS
jgi:error-prone DNA polymerase